MAAIAFERLKRGSRMCSTAPFYHEGMRLSHCNKLNDEDCPKPQFLMVCIALSVF
jgi:hypothetical protein